MRLPLWVLWKCLPIVQVLFIMSLPFTVPSLCSLCESPLWVYHLESYCCAHYVSLPSVIICKSTRIWVPIWPFTVALLGSLCESPLWVYHLEFHFGAHYVSVPSAIMQVYQDLSANIWVYRECVVSTKLCESTTRLCKYLSLKIVLWVYQRLYQCHYVGLLCRISIPMCESTRSVQVKTIVELVPPFQCMRSVKTTMVPLCVSLPIIVPVPLWKSWVLLLCGVVKTTMEFVYCASAIMCQSANNCASATKFPVPLWKLIVYCANAIMCQSHKVCTRIYPLNRDAFVPLRKDATSKHTCTVHHTEIYTTI